MTSSCYNLPISKRLLAKETEKPENGPQLGPRFRWLSAEGSIYVGKGMVCPKILRSARTVHNPAWLANELVYYDLALEMRLRMPEVALLQVDAQESYVGSHWLLGRSQVDKLDLTYLLADADNQNQAMLALVLDLALLNSDRKPCQLLKDREGRLWFIDHDKALWGDCREEGWYHDNGYDELKGDLGRINPKVIEPKFNDFVGDYLACREINRIVWTKELWPAFRDTWQTLSLLNRGKGLIDAAVADLPNDWRLNIQRCPITPFLGEWWVKLDSLFHSPNGYSEIRSLLEARNRI